MRSLNDKQIHWWRSRWWAEDQYVRAIEGKISLADVDAKIGRVARIFDASWGGRTGFHPVHQWLLPQGLEPLQFLIGLGSDLETVDGSSGLNRLIRCLRQPREFESTLLELSLGAFFAASGHTIEFRPKLRNGKEADFSARKNSQFVFFEVKKMRESEAQAAASDFSSRLGFALTDLARPPDGPLAGFRYNVQLSPVLTTIFGAGRNVDGHLIDGLLTQVTQHVSQSVAQGDLSFEIENVGSFTFEHAKGLEGSAVRSYSMGASSELRRVLRSHLHEAISQLHSDFPGIIVIQSPGGLDESLSRLIVTSVLSGMGLGARHVSAVIFLPVTYWLPVRWAMFNGFAVVNTKAVVQATELDAFRELSQHLLTDKVATPSSFGGA